MKGITHFEVGESIDQHLFIKNATKGTASNGKPFLSLTLQDKSGDIEAKLWDVNVEDEHAYIPEAIVRIAGDIQNYKGKNQLRIRAIRMKQDHETVNIGDLLPTAPISKEDMSDQINNYIFEMSNPNLQRITRHLLKKYYDDFFEYPAATKNHHEFFSGLAYHVVSMLNLAKAISELYPSLNKDLLYSGIILHDLGKVIELSSAVATTYTLEGNLLGHITIMVSEINKAADELNITGEEVLILQHIVLSHHGKAEWGSPKPPLVKEAEILHYIDNLDAKMNMMDRALDRVKPGEFTERVYPLENRSFYKPTFEGK